MSDIYIYIFVFELSKKSFQENFKRKTLNHVRMLIDLVPISLRSEDFTLNVSDNLVIDQSTLNVV